MTQAEELANALKNGGVESLSIRECSAKPALKDMREKLGIPCYRVAEKIGVSNQCLANWEANKALPGLRVALRIAAFYGVTVNDLWEI